MMTTEPTHLPCPDALIAGTVALMTAWAAPCSSCSLDTDQQRHLFARKLLSNLLLLQQHPALSPGLRQVMAQAHARWSAVANAVDQNIPRTAHPPRSIDEERCAAEVGPSSALH